jgi:hypothetical protein
VLAVRRSVRQIDIRYYATQCDRIVAVGSIAVRGFIFVGQLNAEARGALSERDLLSAAGESPFG